jgi:hypothetical protein
MLPPVPVRQLLIHLMLALVSAMVVGRAAELASDRAWVGKLQEEERPQAEEEREEQPREGEAQVGDLAGCQEAVHGPYVPHDSLRHR